MEREVISQLCREILRLYQSISPDELSVLEPTGSRYDDIVKKVPSGCSSHGARVQTVHHPDRTDYILLSYFYEDAQLRKNHCVYVYGLLEHLSSYASRYQIVVSTNNTIHKVQVQTETKTMSLLEYLEKEKISVSIFDCSLFQENFLYTVFRFHPMTQSYSGKRNFFLFDLDTKIEHNQQLIDKTLKLISQTDVPAVVYNWFYDGRKSSTLFLILNRYRTAREAFVDKSYLFLSKYCKHCGFNVSRSMIWMFLISSGVSLLAGFTAFLNMPSIQCGDYFDALFFELFFETTIQSFGIDEIYLKLFFIATVINHCEDLPSIFTFRKNRYLLGDIEENNLRIRTDKILAESNEWIKPSIFMMKEIEIPKEYDRMSAIETLETIDSAQALFDHLFWYNDQIGTFGEFQDDLIDNHNQYWYYFAMYRRQKYYFDIRGIPSFHIEAVDIWFADKTETDCNAIADRLNLSVVLESADPLQPELQTKQ